MRKYRKLGQTESTFLPRTFHPKLSIVQSHSSTLEVRTVLSVSQGLPVLLLTRLCPVVNIEKLDTNDSVADACVRLWAIADFLILIELKDEAISILENYCDEKVKAICPIREDSKLFWNSHDCDVLLLQLFRGVETAYTQYPHSVPCQQVLINFFHGVRALVFGRQSFSRAMSKAPLQFSHELFMATISGRESKWTHEKLSDFKAVVRTGNCTFCEDSEDEHPRSFLVDPSMSKLAKAERSHKVRWRCNPCFSKHGFERCRVDDKEL